ncbi:Predicted nucleotidyltransferase [Persephonella hydrogeniphila]|uniref:Predicted nucleotidyltransferase n=1 Tax=Persephonella hydrogeniphila TaxID=198703 RepID=A0A285NBD5_9AQUI|nr:nucleotidyltransferase domain-containing protein [Persephonella hydrogeniphila]SNZ06223.1 Predicted nucleotidyltransferase [Persephonella hydrogeniphila]
MTKTFSQNKVEKYIKRIVDELKKYNPRKIILFGSRAKGTYKKSSDIDIAVDIDLDFREKRKIKERIDQISGLYTVDLIFLSEVTEDFKKRVLEEGVVLYEKK